MTLEEAKKHTSNTRGNGWLPLVDEVFNKLDNKFIITQVFQKWGELWFDFKPYDEDFDTYLESIAEKSKNICSICGDNADEKIINGWVVSLCNNPSCAKEYSELD